MTWDYDRENSNDTPKNKVRISEFCIFQDTELMYRNLCINRNEVWEKLRKIPFTITSKRIKHLGINVTEEVTTVPRKN